MKTSLFAAAVSVLFSISGQAGMEDVQKKGDGNYESHCRRYSHFQD